MWARISIFLVAALMLATAGGAWFGHILSQQVPQATPPVSSTASLAIGENGTGQVPEPPQPRLDGSLGVPSREPVGPNDDVPLVSILDDAQLRITASPAPGASQTDDLEALLLRESNFTGRLAQPQMPPESAPTDRSRPDLPPEMAFAVALPADAPAAPAAQAWRNTLSAALGRCQTQRYFTTRECEQRLRLQHCEPNSGWGQVPECPAHLRNTRY